VGDRELRMDPSGVRIVGARPDGSLLLSNASMLKPREAQILTEISVGKSNREIAATLFLSVHTVEYHATHIYQKLEVRNRTQAAMVTQEPHLLVQARGLSEPGSRGSRDAICAPHDLVSGRRVEARRRVVTAISMGRRRFRAAINGSARVMLGGAAAASIAIAGAGLFAVDALPLSGGFSGASEPGHCVGQPDWWTPPGQTDRIRLAAETACYDTFEEAITALGLDPEDYRPPS
jgi:DNA-binding CsgD family transcriptional regulator